MDCIVNVTQNWGIGRDGDLLVSIPTDLRRFRALTTGKTVIYGRKTLLTFPHARPLPNRENWILSATPGFSVPGAAVFPSLAALQEALRTRPADSLCLIGGASVYRALLPWCSRVLLTQTCADLPADRFFPDQMCIRDRVLSISSSGICGMSSFIPCLPASETRSVSYTHLACIGLTSIKPIGI